MPDVIYTKAQIDAQAAVVGDRIKVATNPQTLATAIDAIVDRNIITDAERTKLSNLESSRFLGLFTSLGAIPTVEAGEGSYADVDAGAGEDVRRAVFDLDTGTFVFVAGTVTSETPASVLTLLTSNPNTNVLTDSQRDKLDSLVSAPDISDYTAALDSALA